MRRKTSHAFLLALGLAMVARAALCGQESAVETGPFTLERCLRLARERSAVLEAERERIESARAGVEAAAAARWPVLDASAHYNYTSEIMERSLALPGGGGLDLRFGDGHQTDLSLGVRMPVYTGGRLSSALEAARAGLSSAEAYRKAALLELEMNVRKAFHDVLGRKARLKVVDIAIERLERHLRDIERGIESGTASAEDRLRARARLVDARQERHGAVAAMRAAALRLGELAGLPGEEIFPEGELNASILGALDTGRLDDGMATARPELSALKEEARRQSLLAEAERSAFLPEISGDIRGHYGRPGVDLLENEWMGYGTARLYLSWTILDAGTRSGRCEQLRAGARLLEARRESTERAFRTALASALTMLESTRQQLAEAEERVRIEREIMKKVELRFELAQASEAEFLDSQDDLMVAESEREMVLTRLRMAEAQLLWTLGRKEAQQNDIQ